ncbi:MAG: glycosyltransferase family 4 protein [bacterium]|nr:glycosyltransferase family 4 protein [bacterium]
MKVLMFGWEFPPHNSGGLGVACRGLVRSLSRLGVEVTFVLPKKVAVTFKECKLLFAEGAPVGVWSVESGIEPYRTSVGSEEGLLYGRSLLEEVHAYGRAARAIARREEFDVIHAHDWLSFKAGMEVRAVKNRPLVVHVHATEFDRSGGINPNGEVYKIEQEGFTAADLIVTVSEYTKQVIISHYQVDPNKIVVAHNGIDREDYDLSPGTSELHELKKRGNKIVLFLGRITLQKGPDYFLKMAKKILDFIPNVFFVIAGSGDMEPQIIRQAIALGIADRLLFAGFLRGEELAEVYRASDIYVMPSVSEPFGLTSLEALLHGTPALISKQSGASEVLGHVLKVDFWDIDEAANKIVTLLREKPLARCLKVHGQSEVTAHSWAETAKKCAGYYEQLLGLRALQTI